MDNATIEKAIESVVLFLSSSVGATILGVIVKAIVSAVASTKNKKYSKLTAGDRSDIATETASTVLDAMKGGVNIEADALLDKYTNGRINALEEKYNALIAAMNDTQKYSRAALAAVGDFRTITPEHKAEIQALLGESAAPVGEITVVPTPTITINAAAVPDEKKTVTY